MEQMLPMMMMANMGSGGGESSGGDGMNMDFLLRMMMPELFEDEIIPMWSSATAFGTRRRQGQDEIGVLELRLVPPTPTTPRASLRLICGGVPVLLRPDELKEIEGFFTRLNNPSTKLTAQFPDEKEMRTGNLSDIWSQAQELEDDMRTQRLVAKAINT